MRAAIAAIVLASMGAILAGCAEQQALPPRRHLSIKDDAPKPEPKAERKPEIKADLSVEERARAEQWHRCGQRHVDYQAGRLAESFEQKRLRDEICAELHRFDYMR